MENATKMQGNFGQEGNKNTLWDTPGTPMKIRAKFPRQAMMPYAMVECPVEASRTPNEMRLWIEEQEKDDIKFQKDDWELVNKLVMAEGKVDVSDKKIIMV